MLILNKNYQFSHKDVGKKALLANLQTVKILTVVREAGQVHSVYGVSPGFTDIISWDAKGKGDIAGTDIIMLLESD